MTYKCFQYHLPIFQPISIYTASFVSYIVIQIYSQYVQVTSTVNTYKHFR